MKNVKDDDYIIRGYIMVAFNKGIGKEDGEKFIDNMGYTTKLSQWGGECGYAEIIVPEGREHKAAKQFQKCTDYVSCAAVDMTPEGFRKAFEILQKHNPDGMKEMAKRIKKIFSDNDNQELRFEAK